MFLCSSCTQNSSALLYVSVTWSEERLRLDNQLIYPNLFHDVEWEGADLLEGVDGDLVLQTSVAPLLQEVIVNFARADENLR